MLGMGTSPKWRQIRMTQTQTEENQGTLIVYSQDFVQHRLRTMDAADSSIADSEWHLYGVLKERVNFRARSS